MSIGGKLRTNTTIKPRLSNTLKNWLPILQSGANEIEEVLNDFAKENPYIEIQSNRTQSLQKPLKKTQSLKNPVTDKIESLAIAQENLHEMLIDQINPKIFPTQTSRKIAMCVIENINQDGFLDSDIAKLAQELSVSIEEFDRVRSRFSLLEPCGVGAKDAQEAFYFQLQESELEGEAYTLASKIIKDLANHATYKRNPHYQKVMRTIKLFKNPPASDFNAKIPEIIPDIFIFEHLKEDSLKPTYELEVRINDIYYPNIMIEGLPKDFKNTDGIEQKKAQDFLKTKLKEAKDLVDALDMRKATILKIALALRENQYNFFMGGEIHPMKLKDIAQDLGYAASTISRAIANKYLECDRGIFPIKSFFTAAIDGDTSNASIKDFILGLVKNENKKKPLSDVKILKSVEEKFGIKIVRRTITKYRQQLNIASSSERKKLYEMSL